MKKKRKSPERSRKGKSSAVPHSPISVGKVDAVSLNGWDVTERSHKQQRLIAGWLSLVLGAALMGVKFYAWKITGSSAILSDALESIINVAASGFALVSIFVSALPPDEGHPYGHGKIEFFSAGFEGGLIILAAIAIFKTGFERIWAPVAIRQLDMGLFFIAGTAVVNLALGIGLQVIGRKTASLPLIADGRHLMTDVVTTAGVLIGLLLVRYTGKLWLDGAVACTVGLQILWTGASLVRTSFSGLMDEQDSALIEKVGRLLMKNRRPAWIDIHQLRAWRSGSLTHIDFHLILPRNLTLQDAHQEGKDLEMRIVNAFNGRASVLIHLDPCNDPECPGCLWYACGLRKRGVGTAAPVWDWKQFTRGKDAAGTSFGK